MTELWWGTGSSSTQCEGAASASDWLAWERAGRAPRSGDGNGFASWYATDFALLAEHGLAHHRLSIEWARIEPEPGRIDPDEVDRYREILLAARAAGIRVWVCLHHFTLPGWFGTDEHGFTEPRSRTYFWPRHVDFVAETFGDLVFGWKPVNEPSVYALLGWLTGMNPPGRRDRAGFSEALEAIHLATFEAALRLRGGGQPVASVQALMPVTAADDSAEAHERARLVDDVLFGCWMGAVRDGSLQVPGRGPVERPELRDAFDLIGFSYYGAATVKADGSFGPYPPDIEPSPLGYSPWSEGLGVVLHRLADELPGHPLLIAEHGLGTTDDARREAFLRASLEETERAVADGIDLRGFFHWTSVDNYEWHLGDRLPFGLFDRDRNPKPSAAVMREAATKAIRSAESGA